MVYNGIYMYVMISALNNVEHIRIYMYMHMLFSLCYYMLYTIPLLPYSIPWLLYTIRKCYLAPTKDAKCPAGAAGLLARPCCSSWSWSWHGGLLNESEVPKLGPTRSYLRSLDTRNLKFKLRPTQHLESWPRW